MKLLTLYVLRHFMIMATIIMVMVQIVTRDIKNNSFVFYWIMFALYTIVEQLNYIGNKIGEKE